MKDVARTTVLDPSVLFEDTAIHCPWTPSPESLAFFTAPRFPPAGSDRPQIDVAKQAQTRLRAGANLLQRLAVGRRIVYDVSANWKLIVENFMECYHCATIHPELTEVLPEFAGGYAAQYYVGHGAAFAEQAEGFTVDGSAGACRPGSPSRRHSTVTRSVRSVRSRECAAPP